VHVTSSCRKHKLHSHPVKYRLVFDNECKLEIEKPDFQVKYAQNIYLQLLLVQKLYVQPKHMPSPLRIKIYSDYYGCFFPHFTYFWKPLQYGIHIILLWVSISTEFQINIIELLYEGIDIKQKTCDFQVKYAQNIYLQLLLVQKLYVQPKHMPSPLRIKIYSDY
jgi:hypothetical protein